LESDRPDARRAGDAYGDHAVGSTSIANECFSTKAQARSIGLGLATGPRRTRRPVRASCRGRRRGCSSRPGLRWTRTD